MRPVAFALLLLAAVPASSWAQTWTRYPMPDAGFAVQLPAPPSRSTTTVTAPAKLAGPAQLFSLKDGNTTYTVQVTDLSSSSISQQDAIREAEKALAAKGTVKAALDARINRQFGRELSVDEVDGGRLVAAVFFVNRHLIQLTGVAGPPNAQGASSNLIRFQQSLEFVGAGGQGGPGGFGPGGGQGGPGGFGGRRGPGGNPQAQAACINKAAGDKVQLDTPNGSVAATCVLVARPDQPPGGPDGGRRGGGRP